MRTPYGRRQITVTISGALIPRLLDINPDLEEAVAIVVGRFFGTQEAEPQSDRLFPEGITDADLLSLERLCALCGLPYRLLEGTERGFGDKFKTMNPNILVRELNEALSKGGYAAAAFDPASGKFHFLKPREQDGARAAA
jgi:hypothetical protein